MRIDVGGQKRRKLLTLVAAFADAGIDDPSIRELSKRAGLDTRMTDQCLRRLAQQGFLTIEKFASDQRRNRYTLQLPSHS